MLILPSSCQTASHPSGLQLIDDVNVDNISW